MTTKRLRVAPSQKIGPLQIWPLLWEDLTPHDYEINSPLHRLEFAEFEEDEGSDVNWIQVHNPTDKAILIPSGWVVSRNLLQERTVNTAEYIEAKSIAAINVSCVEKGRWNQDSIMRPEIRAPISVMAAGFDFDRNRGIWTFDSDTRQARVWKQIKSYEERTGKRETNSLTQIMQEDQESLEVQKIVSKDMNTNLRILPKQNGVLVALNGEPLISEFFSRPEGLLRTVRKTIIAASFDSNDLNYREMEKSQVVEFLDEIRSTKIQQVNEDSWGSHYSGGSERLDAHLTKSPDKRVMRISVINRRHRILEDI